jgi:branched-chain amino acid transport system ATP-binding protein
MTPILTCESLTVGYGGRPVVRDFKLELVAGEIVALVGPNGAGKTTLLATLAGYLRPLSGRVIFQQDDVSRLPPDRRTRLGIALVPESRALFSTLTVGENLLLAQRTGCMSISDITDLFPQLADRLNVRAGLLSGGEQQMLALARALIQRPKALLIDEMTLGLSPRNGERIADRVQHAARATGTAVMLVEQHSDLALRTADRALVLVHGTVVLQDTTEQLRRAPERIQAAYFGTGAITEDGPLISRPQATHPSISTSFVQEGRNNGVH